ncbi:MAG: hypothetical protein LBS55_07450 [Prevotellaceae bacterium]|jgi:hypothetical protein|nr:hypothetical protein [Prevotellaceae bacterium]
MIRDENDILTWLKNFLVHGDFNAPDDFDIFDEIEESYGEKRKPKIERGKDNGNRGGSGIRPPIETKPPTPPKYLNDPLIDLAYRFGKEDEHLELLRNTLLDIRDFEKELEDSFEQLNDKFNTNKYQL